jgi:hypothetical protein
MYSGVTCGNEQCLCCHSGYWDQALTETGGEKCNIDLEVLFYTVSGGYSTCWQMLL